MRLNLRRALLADLRRPLPVRGLLRNVIVVKPEDRRFREALFILRDDYFLDPDYEPEELLRQAREAALAISGTASPKKPKPPVLPLLLLLAALAAAGLKLLGVI